MDLTLERIKQFSDDQYSNENRLKARIQIYDFCEKKINWHEWVFDKLDFSNISQVLELGCGNGQLWTNNINRVPRNVHIVLSDISKGMIDSAREALENQNSQFEFRVSDACETPFEDNQFQMIIANHMLNLIENKEQVFSEIDRLLTDDGFVFASSPSTKNLQELMNMVVGFNKSLEFDNEIILSFNLENGEEVLSDYFTSVERSVYQNDIVINTSDPLLLYLASIYEGRQMDIYIEEFSEFRSYVESVLKTAGEIRITNKNALFRFRK